MDIRVKRIYEVASPGDGFRILVDRLWPRGIKKEKAGIDLWAKNISPSTDLRQWFNHEADKWKDFKTKYHAELNQSPYVNEFLAELKKHKTITFLFSSREEEHNHAQVLRGFVMDRIK